jgi:hypothetical protein
MLVISAHIPENQIDTSGLWTPKRRLQTSLSNQTPYSENGLVSSIVNTEGPTDGWDSDMRLINIGRQTKSRISGLIMYHGVFKRFQKIFLKFEMRQFFFFEKTHGQLA